MKIVPICIFPAAYGSYVVDHIISLVLDWS